MDGTASERAAQAGLVAEALLGRDVRGTSARRAPFGWRSRSAGFDSAFDNVQDFEFMLRLSERDRPDRPCPAGPLQVAPDPGERRLPRRREVGDRRVAGGGRHGALQPGRDPAVAHTHAATRPSHDDRAAEAARDGLGHVVLDATGRPLEGALGGRPVDARATAAIDVVVLEAGERLDSDRLEPRAPTTSLDAGFGARARSRTDWLENLLLHAEGRGRRGRRADRRSARPARVDQAGLILGLEQRVGAAMRGWDSAEDGYAGSLSCAREVSAVSGTGALIARAKLERLGGFSERSRRRESSVGRPLGPRARSGPAQRRHTPRDRAPRDGSTSPTRSTGGCCATWAATIAAADPSQRSGRAGRDGRYVATTRTWRTDVWPAATPDGRPGITTWPP